MANVNFQYRSKKPIANIEVRFTFKENDKFKSYYTLENPVCVAPLCQI